MEEETKGGRKRKEGEGKKERRNESKKKRGKVVDVLPKRRGRWREKDIDIHY